MRLLTTSVLVATLAGAVAAASPAAACTTLLDVKNETDKTINPVGCSTKKEGSDKWLINLPCAEWAMRNNDHISAGDNLSLAITTSRKTQTRFKLRLAYIYGPDGPSKHAESGYATCGDGHLVVVN